MSLLHFYALFPHANQFVKKKFKKSQFIIYYNIQEVHIQSA